MAPPDQPYPLVAPGRLLLQQPVPTRDGGAVLACDVWLPPASSHGDGPWPALLCRSQHGTERYLSWMQRFTNELGLAVVLQDVRGRGDSGGPNPWEPYEHEEADGADSVAWVAEQSWCNGRVGMFGYSYVGFTQTMAALGGHPALQALVPVASQQDNYGHWRVDGVLHWVVCSQVLTMAGRMGPPGNKLGALALFDMASWERTTPLISAYEVAGARMPFFSAVIENEERSGFYSEHSLRDRYAEISAPALFITGWFDSLLHENFKLICGFRSSGGTVECRELSKLVVGPWAHQQLVTPSGLVELDPAGSAEGWSLSFGTDAVVDLLALHERWYRARLLDDQPAAESIDSEPPIWLFVMGVNEWRGEHEWPLERTAWRSCYLQPDASLSWEPPTGTSVPPLSYFYDPRDPCPSVGAQFQAKTTAGPRDRALLTDRPDVLAFETAPLAVALEIVGPITAVIYISSSCVDTDFTAALCVVTTEGCAAVLCEGIARVRFRRCVQPVAAGEGSTDEQLLNGTMQLDGAQCTKSGSTSNSHLMEPGQVYEVTIDMWDTAIQLGPGERIRVDVSSSNFPRFDRNLNTGGDVGYEAESEALVSENTVYCCEGYPSRLILPTLAVDSKAPGKL